MCGTFEYGLNAAAKEFDGKNKYIRITDIDDASREFLLSDLSSPDICLDGMSKYLLSSGDIVFARTGASVGKTYIYRENDGIVYFAGFLIRAKVNQDNDAEFVFQSTLSPSYEKYIRITSQRSGQPGVNAQEYGEYDLFAPSKEEQQRIGHFLRGIDNLITLHQRQPFLHSPPDISLIVQLTPPFYTFSWEQRKLEDYLTVSAEKNTGNIYGRSDVLSVSGDYGIVNQIEFQGRSFAGASVSNYGVVQTGDVVYTKSPLNSNPYGIIKTNKGKPGIVSTLYAVYHPKENAFSDFIQVYFEQHARMNIVVFCNLRCLIALQLHLDGFHTFSSDAIVFLLTGSKRRHSGGIRYGLIKINRSASQHIEKRGIFIFADLYTSFQSVVHCAAVIYDGIVNVPAGERCKSSHIRLILQRRSADSFATNGVKVIIGQERTVRNGNTRADDPVDQVQILQHQGVLIISHVEHLLYATQLFLASTSLQRRISSRHRYSLHMPM